MEAIVEELIEIIAKEIHAFSSLLEILHEKQRAIVEGEIERLNVSVENETELASETKSLESERIKRSRTLAKQLEMENLNPKLSEIIEKVEKRYAKRLQEQRELLRNLVERIQHMNKNNQFLLNHSLNFIEKSMEVLLTSSDPVKVYRKDGKLRKGLQKMNVLDHVV
ncbi:MAG: flagellar protein FlgN [bacterium]